MLSVRDSGMRMTRKIMMMAALLGLMSPVAQALTEMPDADMSVVTGQSLFTSTYVAPGGTNPNAGIGFYRIGVEAKMEINANIDKLRLGCDGAAGTGLCDISIDHLRLTGVAGTDVVNSAPGTDFLLNQPFFEFAIKNPTTPATRQVVGIRFGALEALGAMTIGENPDGANLGEAGELGINTLSGDMTANITNAVMTNVCQGTFSGSGVCGGFAGLSGSATVASFSQALVLKRASIIADLGPMTAQASSSLLGLTLNNTHIVNEPLKAIHRIVVASDANGTTSTSDFYLSMQSQNITWQKTSTNSFTGSVAAQTGWWMSIPQVQMTNITSNAQVEVPFGAVVGNIFGGAINIQPLDLGQKPASNCWGSTNFC